MYFVLDIVCVLILGICAAWFYKATAGQVLIKAACVFCAALLAVFASIPCAPLVNRMIVAPIMEKNAANSLADMVSAEHKGSGRETVKDLNLDDLVADRPTAFREWVEQYQGDLNTVCFAYRSGDAQTMLVNLMTPLTKDVSRAVTYMLLWIICLLVLRFFAWRLEFNSAPKTRKRGDWKNALPPLCGVLYGICIVWGLAVALEWLVPPLRGTVSLLTDETLTKGVVYPLLRVCDPLYWLAQI